MLALALVGCSTVTVEGRVVDGLNGEPIAGPYRMKARATSSDVAVSCQSFDTAVDERGAFKFDRLCPGTAYQLETDRDDLWLVEVDEVPDGGFGTPTDLLAWRVPRGAGVYRLSGGELEVLKTVADVESVTLWKSKEKAKYPANIPNALPAIGPDDHLVLVGKTAVEELRFYPLIETGTRRFGDEKVTWTMEPWWYVGVKFTDDQTYERLDASFDTSRVVDKQKGDRMARFIPGTALPEGRYAVMREEDRRMYLLDFGKAQAPKDPAAQDPAPQDPAAQGPAPKKQ